MVGYITGTGTGLERSSAFVLGATSVLGSSVTGRAGENAYVNVTTGGLVIQKQDEFLVGLGLDVSVSRTYNSLGNMTDENGDNWRQSNHKNVSGLTGTFNSAGSTITRTSWDGSSTVFTYDASRGAYVAKDGAGAYDIITGTTTSWTWTDGDSRVSEIYDRTAGGRLASSADIEGNMVTYTYTGAVMTKVTSYNSTTGQTNYTTLVYSASNVNSGKNLLRLETSYYDPVSATNKLMTRTRYAYDSSHRLTKVTVDLSPEDNSVSDGNVYETSFTYDGTSKRVATMTQTDGTLLAFTYDTSFRVTTVTQTIDTGVTRTTTLGYGSGSTTITDHQGNVTTMAYNAAGQLTRLTAPPAVSGGNSQIVDYSYNSNGDVEALALFDGATNAANNIPLSRETSLYDTNGNRIEQQDLLGNTVRWTYGSLNEVLTRTEFLVADPDGAGSGQPVSPLVTRYVYDDAANQVNDDGTTYSGTNAADVAQKHLRFQISPEGHVTEYRYDASGQILARIDYAATLYAGATYTEGDLQVWAAAADLTQIERVDTTYDFRGNVSTVTSYATTDSSGAGLMTGGAEFSRTTYIYDQAGQLLSRTVDDGGGAETYIYDGLGRTIRFTDRLGYQTSTSFADATMGTVVTLASGLVRTSLHNRSGDLLSVVESHSSIATGTTTYKYDTLGRLGVRTDPVGVKSYVLYDRVGRKTADIAGDGTVVEYRYDAANRLVATIAYATALSPSQIASLVDGSGNPANVEIATIRPAQVAADRFGWNVYDQAGRLVETIAADGAVATYEFDGSARLVKTRLYSNRLDASTLAGLRINGAPTSLTLPTVDVAADRVVRAFYDDDGLLVGTLDEDGYLTSHIYDKAGRKIQSVQFTNAASSSLWADGSLADLKASITTYFTDANNFWVYDGRGLLGATIDSLGNLTRYHYTARGNVDQMVAGQQISMSPPYTLANLPAPSGSLETINYARNALGQVTSRVRLLASGQTETTAYSYDSFGNLLSETTSETVSTETRTNTNRYDAKGRLTGTLSGIGSAELAALGGSPTQTQIDNVYANFGTRYVYDAADYLIAKIEPNGDTGAGYKTLYFYDDDGNLVFEVNALGEVTGHSYTIFSDQSEIVHYGTPLAPATFSGWTGGQVNATVSSAIAGIADTAIDSRIQYSYTSRAQVEQVIDPLGHTETYTYNSFDEAVSVNSQIDTGSFRLTTRSYSRRGLLLSETADAAAGGLNLTASHAYDGFGRRISTTEANGTTRLFEYNRAGWQKSATDALGNLSQFNYDPHGNVIKSIDRNNQQTIYTYDVFSRTITTKTPENLTSSVKRNAYGQTIEFKDAADRVTTYTYDKNGNLKTVTQTPESGTSLVTTNSYDKAGRLLQTVDARGTVIRYTYDAANRVLTRVEDYGSGKLNLTTTYAYDAKGQQISVTDPAGTVSTFTYDLKGRKIRVVQDAGTGNLNIATDYVYRADGKLLSVTEAAGTADAATAEFSYDKLGRLTEERLDPSGIDQVTRWNYDAAGNIVAQTDTLGRTTRYVFDAENREILSVNAEGGVVQTGYDAEGRAVWNKVFATRIAQATVDGWNTASTWQITAAQATIVADPASDRITRTLYDNDGRAVYLVDPDGYVTESRYDAANNLIKTVRYTAAVAVDDTITKPGLASLLPSSIPGGAVQTDYLYDNANRLIEIKDGLGVKRRFTLDAGGLVRYEKLAYGTVQEVVIYREYDALGRMKLEARAATTADAAITQYTYDAMGQVTAITDPLARQSTRSYDAVGRMLSETVPLDATSAAVTLRQYDARGNVVKLTDARGNATYYYYDKLDRVTLTIDTEGYATTTTYGASGTVGSVKRYHLKATGVGDVAVTPTLTSDAKDAVTSFAYDRLDRITGATDAEGFTESYVLDAHGNRVQVTNKLGGVTDNIFDRRGLLVQETLPTTTSWTDGVARRIVNTYSYDSRGNLKQKVEAAGLAEARGTYFEYDKLDRVVVTAGDKVQTVGNNLLSLTEVQPRESMVYDRRGNVIGQTDANGAMTISYYDLLDRKIAELSPTGMLTAWTYDANGNVLTERVYADPVQSLPSDPNAQVAQVYRIFDVAFGRMPSATEISDWVWRMNNIHQNAIQPAAENWPAIDSFGGPLNMLEGIAGEILADPAVQLRLGMTDDSAFIAQIFQLAYRREPSGGETTTWLANIAAGWTRAGMLTYFAENIEHRSISASLIVAEAATRTQPAPVNASNYREVSFAYDFANRRIASTRAAVRTGSFNGTSYETSVGAVGAQSVYDAMGNLVREIDANGRSIFHYYDKRGLETARVDQENYLTTFARDSEGNVVAEQRFATAATGTVTAGAIPTVAAAAQDRETLFTYDRNGQRTAIERTGITAIMDGATGTVASSPVSATVHYTYNGLGLVSSKTEANGDVTTYSYDAMGRQTQVAGTAYTDYSGATVQPVSVNAYDGLSNLVRTVENGTRTTTLTYGDGGRLASIKDAANFTISYSYDLAGHVIREKYDRVRSNDFAAVTEAKFHTYDAAGRVLREGVATKVGVDWTMGDNVQSHAYNGYGELVAKSLNGVVQEQFAYDNAGRLEKSSGGDGVWRFYIYDANGNATLTLASNGRDMAGDTIASLLTHVGAIDTSSVTDVVATIALYDGRGLTIGTREPNRELGPNASNPALIDQATLVRARSYTAFGELASETNASGQTTDYLYNTLGRLIEKRLPTVSVTAENGAISSVCPTEYYYYDVAGRMTGMRDANDSGAMSTLSRRTLLAGTGHDDPAAALVATETRADGSTWISGYDAFGDAVRLTDGLGRVTEQLFDGVGRLTQVVRPSTAAGQLTEYYAYDGLGQRIKHWNSRYGTNYIENSNYDSIGRVVSTTNFAGDETITSYAWNGSYTTTGLGQFGGWLKTVSTIADRYSTTDAVVAATEQSDGFGRVLARTDMGATFLYSMTFNKAGQLVQEDKRAQFNNVLIQRVDNSYYNTGLLAASTSGGVPAANSDWSRLATALGYDAEGRRTYERLARETGDYTPEHVIWLAPGEPETVPESYVVTSALLQDGRASYDALGRMSTYTDLNAAGGANAAISWEYDAVGNIRHMNALYKAIDANGTLGTSDSLQDYWYKYDPLGHVVTTKGLFTGTRGSGAISRGSEGSDIAYNGAGERATATSGLVTAKLETYVYDGMGQLSQISVRLGGGTDRVRAEFTRDKLGRVTDYFEYDDGGALVHARYDVTYNRRDQVLMEKSRTKQGSDWIYAHSVNFYTETGDAVSAPEITVANAAGTSTGTILYVSRTKNWKNGSFPPVYGTPGAYSQADLDYADAVVTNSYSWIDSAVQTGVTYVNRDGTTSAVYAYDANSALASVDQTGGTRPRDIFYVTDAAGRVLERSEVDNNAGQADPRQRTYRFDGVEMGTIGNNGTDNVDYDAAIAERTAAVPGSPGAFRGGATTGTPYADFDQSYDAFNGAAHERGSATVYTVRGGETLSTIAQGVWGDASLWYMIAAANGLNGTEALIEGQMLVIPDQPANRHNNASTVRPYDPASAIGDTQPGAPKPPKKGNKCGVFGQILIAVVAIAVAAIAGPSMIAAAQGMLAGAGGVAAAGSAAAIGGGIIGGAAAGALSSVVSQGFGVAVGAQSGFSWKAVGMAAIGGGIGAGMGATGAFSGVKSGLVGAVLKGVTANALTQGIGVATKLQNKFSWTGVAAAGVSAGAMQAVGGNLPEIGTGTGQSNSIANYAAHLGTSGAGALAAASVRSLIDGSDFGDNLIAALPDVIGQTLGNMLAHGVAASRSTVRGGGGGAGGGMGEDRYAGGKLARLQAEMDSKRPFGNLLPVNSLNPSAANWSSNIWDRQNMLLTFAGWTAGGEGARVDPDIVVNGERGSSLLGGILNHALEITQAIMRAQPRKRPTPQPALLPGQRLQYEFAMGAWDGTKSLVNSLGSMAQQGLDISPIGFANAGMEMAGWKIGPNAPNARNVFERGAKAAALGADVGAHPGAYAERAKAAISETLDRIDVTLRAAAAGDGDAMRSLARFGGRATFEAGTFLFGAGEANAVAKGSTLVGKAEVLAADSVALTSRPRLLPGEGAVGTFDDLIRAGSPGDNITPHHIPSRARMELEGVSKGDGISINIEQRVPGSGGRHRATFTYGTQADIAMTPREALAAGVWDARQIYRADGLYTPQIRSSLQEMIQMNKTNYPIIFRKPGQ